MKNYSNNTHVKLDVATLSQAQIELRKQRVMHLLKACGNRFLTVNFYKQDGTLRTLNGRFRVKHNGAPASLTYNTKTGYDYLLMWDRRIKDFRRVNPLSIVSVVTDGMTLSLDLTV